MRVDVQLGGLCLQLRKLTWRHPQIKSGPAEHFCLAGSHIGRWVFFFIFIMTAARAGGNFFAQGNHRCQAGLLGTLFFKTVMPANGRLKLFTQVPILNQQGPEGSMIEPEKLVFNFVVWPARSFALDQNFLK